MNLEILLAKLHFCGIRGISEDWFRSNFTNRRQKFEVKSPKTAHIYGDLFVLFGLGTNLMLTLLHIPDLCCELLAYVCFFDMFYI
jgi:hypothetical protein